MADRRRRGSYWPYFLLLAIVGGVIAGAWLFPDGPLADPALRTLEVAGEEVASFPLAWDRVRVEVLNAGGVRGMAGQARDVLRTDGFDVVFFGNADQFGREHSAVLARNGQYEVVRTVAEALGIETVLLEPDGSRLVDVTVLLGSDWTVDPGEGPGSETTGIDARTSAWWDVRRFLHGVR